MDHIVGIDQEPALSTIDEPAAPFARDRACNLLGLAPEGSCEDQQRRALELLEQCDYEATAAQQEAIEVIFGRGGRQVAAADWSSFPDLRNEVEFCLGEEIEEFAAHFFEIEPAERSNAWSRLRERAEFSPVLRRRLQLIEPGLSLEVPKDSPSGELEVRLLNFSLAIFARHPAARFTAWIAARNEQRRSPRE